MSAKSASVAQILRADFARRATAPELMDDPHSDRRRLERTLAQFARINRVFSRYGAALRGPILHDAAAAGLKRFSVLDVGGGGGDIARRLVDDARRRGFNAEVTILEADPRVAAYARCMCATYPQITVQEGSALELPPAHTPAAASTPGEEAYDYVISNHLLHHFRDEDLPELLRRMCMAARRLVIANDLLRSRPAAVAFAALARLCFPDSFAAFDGALSINKGFRPPELRAALARAGLTAPARVYTLIPGRVVAQLDLRHLRTSPASDRSTL